jgi:hypothetical protein
MSVLGGLYDKIMSIIKTDTVAEPNAYTPVSTDIVPVYDYSAAADSGVGEKIAPKKYVRITDIGTGTTSTYDLDNPTISLGGIIKGSNSGPSNPDIQGMTWQEVIQALLAPYQAPAIETYIMVGQSTAVEVGTTISGNKSFNITYTNTNNVQANTFEMSDNVGGTFYGPNQVVPNSGVNTSPIAINTVTLNTNSSVTWTAKFKDIQNVFKSSTFTVNWQYKVYVGASVNTTVEEAEIETFNIFGVNGSSGAITNTAKRPYNFNTAYTPPRYLYFCFPNTTNAFTQPVTWTADGQPFSLTSEAPYIWPDGNGKFFAKVNLTNANNIQMEYRVYRSFNPMTTGAYSVILT